MLESEDDSSISQSNESSPRIELEKSISQLSHYDAVVAKTEFDIDETFTNEFVLDDLLKMDLKPVTFHSVKQRGVN